MVCNKRGFYLFDNDENGYAAFNALKLKEIVNQLENELSLNSSKHGNCVKSRENYEK